MNLRDKVIIPHHWTSEEATAVIQFLDQIADAIWDVHGDGIIELSGRVSPAAPDECPCPPATSFHDDFPSEPPYHHRAAPAASHQPRSHRHPPASSLQHTPQAFRERPYPNPDVEWLAIQDWIRFAAVTGSVRHRR